MYIATNRFKVKPELADEFEKNWIRQDLYIRSQPGFVTFHFLRGPATEDHVLYASHTLWRSREDFNAWLKSDGFKQAHRMVGQSQPLHFERAFEGFDSLLEVGPAGQVEAA